MGLVESIRDILNEETEEIGVSADEASEVFYNRKKEKIDKGREEADSLVSKTSEVLNELDKALEELTGYKDSDGIQAVEDVAENFKDSRKRLIKDFEASEEVEEHFNDLDDFVKEFNEVSMKEGAVMQRVEQDSGTLSGKISQVIEHRDEMEEFLENEYRPVNQLEEIERAVEEINKLDRREERLQQRLEELDEVSERQELEELKQSLEDLKNSEEWNEKNDAESELQDIKDSKKEIENKLSRNTSKLERGLKKLIYNIRNQGVTFSGDVSKLEELRDGNYNVSKPLGLEEASEIISEENLLSDRQFKKFRKAVESFDGFEQDKKQIESLESDLGEKKRQIESFDVIDERERIEREIKEAEKNLDDLTAEREDLQLELEELKKDREASLDSLEDYLNKWLDAAVVLKHRD